MEHFFATCPRGLEDQLAGELIAAGATRTQAVPGGVGFAGDWETCYRANLWSRIATRILWRVAHGPYSREEAIYRLAHGVPWHERFAVRRTLRVYMTAIRCPLKSIDFITLRIKDAVCDRFRAETGERPSVDTAEPNVRIHAFLSDREATLYLDTSGEPLYKRGFKYASVEAPLKENLAAGILRRAGWEPGTPLLDPMCGSGTFLLEAALMAHDIAPGLERKFGFLRLNNFDATLWQKLLAEAEARKRPVVPQPIFGSDISRTRSNGRGRISQRQACTRACSLSGPICCSVTRRCRKACWLPTRPTGCGWRRRNGWRPSIPGWETRSSSASPAGAATSSPPIPSCPS